MFERLVLHLYGGESLHYGNKDGIQIIFQSKDMGLTDRYKLDLGPDLGPVEIKPRIRMQVVELL